MSLPSRLLGANPSIQVSTLLSGSLSTPSAKGAFVETGIYESIASFTGTGQSTITFSSIPTTFQHLQVRMITRLSSSSTTDVYMRFNGNSSAVYNEGHIRAAAGNSTVAGYNIADSTYFTALQSTGTGSTTDLFGVAIIDIFNYNRSNAHKAIRSVYGNCHPTTSNGQVRYHGGLFASQTAITSIVFTDSNAGNFLTGSQISLYGIRG
jgi:hypothetical protein